MIYSVDNKKVEDMSVQNTTSHSFPVGIGGIVFLIFMTLKLAGIGVVASWSWWWVTAPLWGPIALIIGIMLLVAGGAAMIASVGFLCGMIGELFNRKNK